MAKVLAFDARKKKTASKQKPKSQAPIDRETYYLWQLSQNIDHIVTEGVIGQSLKVEEVAAVLAHRLATLAKRADNPTKLLEFCQSLLNKIISDKGTPDQAV
jgi:hypothetical protein